MDGWMDGEGESIEDGWVVIWRGYSRWMKNE